MQQIPAKNLATGDVVFFPKVGKRTVLRLTGKSITSVQALFDDGKRRSLPVEKQVFAELATTAPIVAGENELLRLDLKTNRVSIISTGGFLWDFDDVKKGFDTLRVRVTATRENIALSEIRRGSLFYTSEAVYSKVFHQATTIESQGAKI